MNRQYLVAIGAILLGLAIFAAALILALAPRAGAQPDVSPRVRDYANEYGPAMCATLDSFPGPDGVAGLGIAIMRDGFTGYQAGQAIGLGVYLYCPDEHWSDVMAFAQKYGG